MCFWRCLTCREVRCSMYRGSSMTPSFAATVWQASKTLPCGRFWVREYQKFPATFRAEAISPIQNKIGEFLVNPFLRRIVGQAKSTFDLRHVMDQGKILLVNL